MNPDKESMKRTAAAFRAAAPQLAQWAFTHLFARTDRYGGYYKNKADQIVPTTRPKKAEPGAVTVDLLTQHFRGVNEFGFYEPRLIVGAYPLAPGTSVGRWLGGDYDAHDGTDFDPGA